MELNRLKYGIFKNGKPLDIVFTENDGWVINEFGGKRVMRYFSEFETKIIDAILEKSEEGKIVSFYDLMHEGEDSIFKKDFLVLRQLNQIQNQPTYYSVDLWIPKTFNLKKNLHRICGPIYDFVFLFQYLIENKYIVLTKEIRIISRQHPEEYEKISFLNEDIKKELNNLLSNTIYPTQKLFNLRKNKYVEIGIKIEKERFWRNFAISSLAVLISIASFIYSIKVNTINRNVTLEKESIESISKEISLLMQEKRVLDEQVLEVRIENIMTEAITKQRIDENQNDELKELRTKLSRLENEITKSRKE